MTSSENKTGSKKPIHVHLLGNIHINLKNYSWAKKFTHILCCQTAIHLDNRINRSLWTFCPATWSSGSTFLTKLLTHYPGVFLSFEPLVLFSTYDALHDVKARQARSTLRDIFHCNFTEKSWGRKYLKFIQYRSGYKQFALHNLRLRSVCEGLAKDGSNKLCYDPNYVQSICSLHPINLVKTVRMRTRQIAPILDEPGTIRHIHFLWRRCKRL